MTQRDGMGREVGGGFRMGNMCTPVADVCWCVAKPIQYCKVKKKFFFKTIYCHPAYLTFLQRTSCEMPSWMTHKLESRVTGEISTTSIRRWYHFNGRKWRGINEPLNEGERGEWKSWLQYQHSENYDHGIWSRHLMANRWGNSANSERLYFLVLQNHCGWWLQPWNLRHLLLGRKVMINLNNILKSRDISLMMKIHIVKAKVFSVVMYGCESWTINKAEHRRIVAFKLWCWRRLLRVPWTTRRWNQSFLKEINFEYSLEG